MKKVRIAVVGLGVIGRVHLRYLPDLEEVEITALCDVDAKAAEELAATHNCQSFSDHRELIKADICDAMIIATPHYSHTPIGIDALKAGLHVLVEKPISVHKADCQQLVKAHRGKGQVFAAMFNLRTDPCYQKVKQLIDRGELGEITRVNWIITNWFRSDAYYRSGSWRATWAGEGGGVLLNQCPHQLDMLQWLCGMPKRVRAFCRLGKWHDIEVEDDVTAYLEYPNGATGVFITTTGEAPGTNRLEIVGQQGKLTVENGKIRFIRNEVPADHFCQTTGEMFARPETWNVEIPVKGDGGLHQRITQNFVNSILHGEKIIAPAQEGANSVELANAMLYSSLTESTVELPLDADAYERKLKELIKNSNRKV